MRNLMNADSYFSIGKSHVVCEDYALCAERSDGKKVIALSDGCSSSKDTDVGARLLVHSALYYMLLLDVESVMDYRAFGKAVIDRAYRAAEELLLPTRSLEATLIVAVELDDEVYVACYGDGIVIASGDFGTFYHTVSFDKCMPYYLSYWLNKAADEHYASEITENTSTPQTQFFAYLEGNGSVSHVLFDEPFTLLLPRESWVGISSDGLESFRTAQGGVVTIEEVLKEVAAFKNFKGVFVQRRMKRLLKDFAVKGIFNHDDVSLGVLFGG